MINSGFADALHRTGFTHRARFMPDGTVIYRLRDGTASVRLPRTKWDAIGGLFNQEVAAIGKRTRMLNICLFPAVLVFGMTIAGFLPYGGALILLGIFGGPLVIYLRHSRLVQQCAGQAEAKLGRFPRTAAVAPPADRPPRVLQIAAMILVGPHLIVSAIGQVGGPDTFRNTPLSGAHLGPGDLVAFAVLVLILLWPRLAPRILRPR